MHRQLPYLVFLLFVMCCALSPQSAFYTHHLNDPDDYMRLQEVASWLQGQGWYDLSVPRLSPGAGTVVHWSRLVDLPIAAFAQPFIGSYGTVGAVMIASFIVPLLWCAVFLTLLYHLAKPLIGEKHASIACLLFFCAPPLMFNYRPGRVDHHGIQVIIAGFGLLTLSHIFLNNRGRLFAVLSALVFACGFWIGTEALPCAILFITCLTLAAAWQGGQIARDGAVFGIALPLFTAALVPLALPPAEFSSQALSWFSPAYALFSALAGAVLTAGWGLRRYIQRPSVGLALYAACALLAGCTFFILIPSALRGPFADYDTFDATTALDNISEAVPLIKLLHFNRFMPASLVPVIVTCAKLLVLPAAGVIGCLIAIRRTQGTMRMVWLANGVFLGATFVLTLLWQSRVGIFMELFMMTPLLAAMGACWKALKRKLEGRRLFWAEIAVFALLGPLPVYVVPDLAGKLMDLHAPAQGPLATVCTSGFDNALKVLNDPQTFGAQPHTIMNISDSGPALLLLTRHNVVSGNFDVPGNEDAFTFFHAIDDAEARAAARKWRADLVVMCKAPPTLYLGANYYASGHTGLRQGDDGLLHLTNTDTTQPLIARLDRGQTPIWLKKIEIPGPSDYLIFSIEN